MLDGWLAGMLAGLVCDCLAGWLTGIPIHTHNHIYIHIHNHNLDGLLAGRGGDSHSYSFS